MRKQTKLVAVLSAAALLTMGASMTSFAAGWQKNDDGTWNYYDSDDEMAIGEWKKDGSKWFYLDDDGIMMTDSWVDDEKYVGDDGAMLASQWKKALADNEGDDPEDDGERWYYFDSKGKKTTGDKKIDGKHYFFDDEGKMQDGWYADTNDANLYYCGGEDDGARASGWLWLSRPCTDDDLEGSFDDCEICDDEGWYYFNADGKMYMDGKKKKVNGKFYYFNEHGQMLYSWINNFPNAVATDANAWKDGDFAKIASPTTALGEYMLYTNTEDQGWRADGWYQIDGSEDTDTDDETSWYYFKDGKAKQAEILYDNFITYDEDQKLIFRTKIKVEGKYFCFDETGRMQTGLQVIDSSGTGDYEFYYFDSNGYMKTGKVANVEEDEDSFTYNFNTNNGKNGVGVTGEKDGYLYYNGKRLEADDDYRLYTVNSKIYLVDKKGKIQKSTSRDYLIENEGWDSEEHKIRMKGGSKYEIAQVGDVEFYDEDGAFVLGEGKVPNIQIFVSFPYIELYDDIFGYLYVDESTAISGFYGENVPND